MACSGTLGNKITRLGEKTRGDRIVNRVMLFLHYKLSLVQILS